MARVSSLWRYKSGLLRCNELNILHNPLIGINLPLLHPSAPLWCARVSLELAIYRSWSSLVSTLSLLFDQSSCICSEFRHFGLWIKPIKKVPESTVSRESGSFRDRHGNTWLRGSHRSLCCRWTDVSTWGFECRVSLVVQTTLLLDVSWVVPWCPAYVLLILSFRLLSEMSGGRVTSLRFVSVSHNIG
jgi:hypothetical protein